MEQLLGKSSEDILATPQKGGRSLSTKERETLDLSNQIVGWGSDLDPAVRPGVPMDKAPHLGVETLYPNFEQQVPRAKVHKSVEHAKLTPVFGNVCPPKGLSGIIRDVAYGYSEGQLKHWLLLMGADRVDVAEEILSDLIHLRGPNILHELGFRAELKYNKKGLTQAAAVVGVGALAFMVVRGINRRRQERLVS